MTMVVYYWKRTCVHHVKCFLNMLQETSPNFQGILGVIASNQDLNGITNYAWRITAAV